MGLKSGCRGKRPQVIAVACGSVIAAILVAVPLASGPSALARPGSGAPAVALSSDSPGPVRWPARRGSGGRSGSRRWCSPRAWPSIRPAASGWRTPATTGWWSSPRSGECWPRSARTWTSRPVSPPTRPGTSGWRTPATTGWWSSPLPGGRWRRSARPGAAAASWTNRWRSRSRPSAMSGSPTRATAGWRSSPPSAGTAPRSPCRRCSESRWTPAATSGYPVPVTPWPGATRSASTPRPGVSCARSA